ncbi:unnamed protein product [Ilex paraguariensis]
MEGKSFSEVVSELQSSAEEVISLARDSETRTGVLIEFSILVEKLSQLLSEFRDIKLIDTPPNRKAMNSLETELQRAKALIRSSNFRSSPLKHVEDLTQNLGRSLGLLLFASHDLSISNKEKIEELRKEMMNARFSEVETEEETAETEEETEDETEEDETEGETVGEIIEEKVGEIVEEKITLNSDDIVLKLKYGNDEELRCALSGFNMLFRDNMITNEWIDNEGIVAVLFNRLASSKPNNRLIIIQILRSLVTNNEENKGKMADIGYLTPLVKSLARDVDEQRESVGLLSTLSDVSAIRRRIGRIQGCIVMLVAILNGGDQVASHDARKLLNALSSNTQNALHMAEAGYFKPLVQYLKEGSDMGKILMATALSRMELTDQSRASLGEDGAIEPLVKMFNTGKLESKLSSLNALQNLSNLRENTQQLASSGIVVSLLQLLFSVTSVLMTLREPASAILAKIAESESVLVNQDVAQQMLSLLNLSSPVIQFHLLQVLNSIAAHSAASIVRRKMKENGAIQLLLPFLAENRTNIRTGALNVIYTLSKDLQGDLTEQLGENNLNLIASIISSSASESEKAAAVGILSNIPISDKKATDILKKANLVPLLVSIMSSSPATSTSTTVWMAESIAAIFVRFTVSSDKKLQLYSTEHGVIQVLVKLLSNGSPIARSRAATSLAQLSQNTLSLRKSKTPRWLCVSPSVDGFCEVHDGYCHVKTTFCLIKTGVVSPLIKILEGNERETDEAVLGALATLLQDEIWENGSNYMAKKSGVQAILRVLELGNVKAQEKTLWMLERIFRVEDHRVEYGESAQVLLIDLAQKGDPHLKSKTAKLLAQLELLQLQSSYF